ncbi:hypothetical protein [Spongiivirga citrea]|uniref:DUF4890 domain-containing protein n=1 Tax=Spongiivirga citrea TaxID=1481457 RepID=A0A6M0CLB8_9FLAO|nr:hypothetical protein [Spongiivirga citrea]NER18718.1 hypothetical protein [Spongiivirga citrea]
MKKIFLLLAIVSITFASAQSKAIPLDQASSKDLAAAKVKEMDKMLNLTDEQEKKLIALYSDKNMMSRKPKSVKELQSKRAMVDAKLKAILTPEQFKKLTGSSSGKEKQMSEEPKERY